MTDTEVRSGSPPDMDEKGSLLQVMDKLREERAQAETATQKLNQAITVSNQERKQTQREQETKKEDNKSTEASKNFLVKGLKESGRKLARWTGHALHTIVSEGWTWLGSVTLPASIMATNLLGLSPLVIAAGAIPHALGTVGGWIGGVNRASGTERAVYLATKGLSAGISVAAGMFGTEALKVAGTVAVQPFLDAAADNKIDMNEFAVALEEAAKKAGPVVGSAWNSAADATKVGLIASGATTLIGSRHRANGK